MIDSGAEAAASALLVGPRKMLIGADWVDAAQGQTIDVIDPATGQGITTIAAGGAPDIDRAARAARAAFEGPWSRLTPMQRTRLMLKLADLMERDAPQIAAIETADVGQPTWLANGAAGGAPDVMRYYAGWASKIYGETVTPLAPGEWHAYTRREAIGVVGMIVPWNSPYSSVAPKLGALLAAGCTAVIKPAENASLALLKLAELVLEAGIPEGVVNVVTGLGRDAGAALVDHPEIDKISFTGSTETGQAVLRATAGTMKRVTLELGGKSPIIVLADADVDKAAGAAASAMMLNSGQICTAGTRTFVHESIRDAFLDTLVARAQSFKVGPGSDPANQMGPLISAAQLDRVAGYIASGQEQGAQLLTGGKRIGTRGFFVEPTVFADARPGMRIVDQEIFGPVQTVQTFGDDDLDAIARRANETIYGLSAYVWTRDLSSAHKLAARIKAGVVQVNAAAAPETALPFGGFKQSGIGRERGRAGVEMYTEIKSVLMAL